MNRSDIASTASKYAPLVGAALSSPVGAAIGVGTIIANIFGVDAKPEKVLEYITANLEKAQERLQFEMANNIVLQHLILEKVKERNRHQEQGMAIEFQNVDSARKNSANINASSVDNQIKMILVIGMFILLFICISSYLIFHEDMNQSIVVTLGAIMGSLMTSKASMVDFCWALLSALSARMK